MKKPIVTNAKVYGLDESIKAAKFPMSVDIDSLDTNATKGVVNLATSEIGHGHDQFLTGITVQFDLNCTNKMWVEAERYRFLFFVSSQSTMHRITKFNLDEAYCEYVDKEVIGIMKDKVWAYNDMVEKIDKGIYTRADFDEELKRKYLEILYTNPAGFILTARMTTNYRQLKTIYQQRKNHRLPEWREFCQRIEGLPMSNFITGEPKA